MNTSEVVLAVSTITPFRVSSILKVRQPLQISEVSRPATAIIASTTPSTSRLVSMLLMLVSNMLVTTSTTPSETRPRMAGTKVSLQPGFRR